MRECRRGGERERGMKMQKGAGGLAQYRSGGASAFILFFVRRRVARSFLQDGRAVRARRCITSVTRTPSRESRQRTSTLPIGKGSRRAPSAAWRIGRFSPNERPLVRRLRYSCERSARSFARIRFCGFLTQQPLSVSPEEFFILSRENHETVSFLDLDP